MMSVKRDLCGFWTDRKIFNLKIIFCFVMVEIMVSFSPLGFIPMQPITITTAHLPVIVAALWGGPVGGAIVGAVFGLCSMWKAEVFFATPIDVLFAPFASGTFLPSLMLSLGSRIMFGLLAGLLFLLVLQNIRKCKLLAVALLAVVVDRLHAVCVYIFLDVLFAAGIPISSAWQNYFAPDKIAAHLLAVIITVAAYRLFSSDWSKNFYKECIAIMESGYRNSIVNASMGFAVMFFTISLLCYLNDRMDMILLLEHINITEQGNMRFINAQGQYMVAVLAMFSLILDVNNYLNGRTYIQQLQREERDRLRLQEALAQAERANSAKSKFLFSMSHDIRTPMNAIVGYADLLAEKREDEREFNRCLGNIKVSSEYLLNLINNVLDMARIESGKVVLDDSTIGDVSKLCSDLKTVFFDIMKKKHFTFKEDLQYTHRYVYVDVTKMQQVIVNIFSNATKYTPAGGTLGLSVHELDCSRPGYARYCITISDTGVGMSEEFLQHVFDDFSRALDTTHSKIQGTGLGMGIAKKLVELMGGTIEVRSKLGKGTSVAVTLELRLAPEPQQESGQEQVIDENIFQGKRVLLAEDNELNADIAGTILEDIGLQVDFAEDGQVCVNKLTAAEPGYYDLILMDVQMPVMNGYEATKAIRRLPDRQKALIPILAMTANAFEEDKREAMLAGMNGHLTKPINVNDLEAALHRELTRKAKSS